MTAYATVADYQTWTGLADEPLDLEAGLEVASRFFDRLPQVQAKYVLEEFADHTSYITAAREAYRDAVCAQTQYWVEIAGGEEVDFSQDILRPVGGYSRVGAISIPQYRIIAPVAIEQLQMAGFWYSNPARIAANRYFYS